jgi:integrase
MDIDSRVRGRGLALSDTDRPTTHASNWSRALRRGLAECGQPPLRIYDCRHAAATTWLRAGVPLGEVAKRLGHSVETLVSTYVGAISGDEELGNRRIEAALAGPIEVG